MQTAFYLNRMLATKLLEHEVNYGGSEQGRRITDHRMSDIAHRKQEFRLPADPQPWRYGK